MSRSINELPFLLFFYRCCQLRTRTPSCGHIQDQTAQSYHTSVLHRQHHGHRYRTLPCLHRNRASDWSSVALLCMLPEGLWSQRIEFKLQNTWNSLVTKHSIVNLVLQAMSFQASWNNSRDVFLREACWWFQSVFICSCNVFVFTWR